MNNNLANLGIEDHEFLTDVTERSPYNLVPDYDNENSIRIFYKNNHYSEPIESRSHVVFTLAKNKPHMIRGFVIPEKYDLVKGLPKNYI